MQFLSHVWQSRPSVFEACLGFVVWGGTVSLCLLGDYLFWQAMLPPRTLEITALFGFGAAIAAPIAFWCARIIARKNASSAFSAMFIFLSIGTVGATSLIFAFNFWLYFSQWHGTFFSKLWLIQFVFTFASAIYQFMVSGLRLYLPFGLLALVAASFWFSRSMTR